MRTPEGRVKSKVKALLAQYPVYGNWPVPGGYGEPMLDFVGCLNGRFFAIETKAPGEKLTPRQEFIKSNMESAGGKVFVITGLNSEMDDPSTWTGWADLQSWLEKLA